MKISIVDDVVNEQTALANNVETYGKENHIQCEIDIFSSGDEFLQKGDFNYDIIFLDIYMDGTNGMETARIIKAANPAPLIIFTTTSTEFAIDSYRIRAFDYLLKPYTYEQLSETLDLCVKKLSIDSYYIVVKSNRMNVRLKCNTIYYADYHNHYVQIHTQTGIIHSKMYFEAINEMLSQFPQFLQCNRHCIVNMDQIAKLEKLGFRLKNGECLALNTKADKELRQAYAEYIFDRMGENTLV